MQSITDNENAISYTYNGDGLRTSKTVNGTKTEYFYNGSILAGQKTGDDTLVFMYDNNSDIFGFIYNDVEYYYVKNAQNDVIAIADANSTVLVKYFYDAWGKITSITKADGSDITDLENDLSQNILNISTGESTPVLDENGNPVTEASTEVTLARINPILYRSYYYDKETEWYYLTSRFYNPEFCRFINSDNYALPTATPTELTDKNLFAYCDNNPITRTDSNGKFWHFAVGAVVGAAFSGITQIIINKSLGENWSDGLGVAIATGAASGLLAASGVGLVGAVVGNAAISVAGNVTNQVIKNKGFNNFDVGDMIVDGVIGAVAGAIGGKGMGKSANIRTLNNNFTKKVFSGSYSLFRRGRKYYLSQTKTIYKRFLFKSMFRSGVASTIFNGSKKLLWR